MSHHIYIDQRSRTIVNKYTNRSIKLGSHKLYKVKIIYFVKSKANKYTYIYIYIHTYIHINTHIRGRSIDSLYSFRLHGFEFISRDIKFRHLRSNSNIQTCLMDTTTPLWNYQTLGIQSPKHNPKTKVLDSSSRKGKWETSGMTMAKQKQRITQAGCHSKYVSAGWSETDRRGNQRSCKVMSIRLQISCPNGEGFKVPSAKSVCFIVPVACDMS